MYAKSFMALDGNGRLTGARAVQTAPYDRYRCHLCGSALQYHPEYQTGRPWFEHRRDALTENGRQYCPYVNPTLKETRHIRQLQSYVPEVRPLVFHADWHCSGCDSDYHGERYCLACRTGEYSQERADMAASTPEVTACAC
ncbi:putative zinc ribbon protein [Enterobacter kobei]|uniref:putative zinc ribbon protein n=1 Tax=Enterobacter kobei TaxID=208224 RepID=UPI003CEE4AA9